MDEVRVRIREELGESLGLGLGLDSENNVSLKDWCSLVFLVHHGLVFSQLIEAPFKHKYPLSTVGPRGR